MSNEQSIRDVAAEWIAGLISGNGFGDDYVDDEVKRWADELLASPVIRRIQAEAWDEGFEKATDLTGEDFWSDTWSDDHNPYRGETA